MVNLSQLESTIISICVPMKQHLASPGRRGNHDNSATGQPPAPVKLIESARQPRNPNVSNGSLGYDVYPTNGTRGLVGMLIDSKRQ